MGSGRSRPVEEENQAEPQELRTVTLRFKIDKQPMFTEHPITDGVVPEVFVMLDEFDYEDMGLRVHGLLTSVGGWGVRKPMTTC